jgi:hypothetical protein
MLPALAASELQISQTYQSKRPTLKPLRIPDIASVKLGHLVVEFCFESLHRGREGPTQRFNLRPIKTGFGLRYSFECQVCGKGHYKLYYHNRSLIGPCNGRYACEAVSRQGRQQLAAMRIENLLSKPMWRQTRERLLKRFGPKLLRAQHAYGTQVRNLY